MKLKTTMLVAISCLAAAAAFGQARQGAPKGIAGKWGTDSAIAHLANPAAAAQAGQAVMLDLKVDASNKVTGSITEFGNALCGSPDTNLPIDSGTVDGKMVTFQTTRPACPGGAGAAPGAGRGNQFVQGPPAGGGAGRGGGGGTAVIWTGTLGDDDVLTVSRAIQGGGRGGGGRGGPGGPPPANNFVQGQGGGGGGRGGGAGGGRGGGGGNLIMHSIP